jgi:hypothetical protein
MDFEFLSISSSSRSQKTKISFYIDQHENTLNSLNGASKTEKMLNVIKGRLKKCFYTKSTCVKRSFGAITHPEPGEQLYKS